MNRNGFGFEAVKDYKKYSDQKDKYLIYKVDENNQTVFKTSKSKLQLARNMCTDEHFLSTELSSFDGCVKRMKNYTTLSASIYHSLLRKQVCLASMECKGENHETIEIFWRQFNEAYIQANQCKEKFLPCAGWVTDMADANFLGLKCMAKMS